MRYDDETRSGRGGDPARRAGHDGRTDRVAERGAGYAAGITARFRGGYGARRDAHGFLIDDWSACSALFHPDGWRAA